MELSDFVGVLQGDSPSLIFNDSIKSTFIFLWLISITVGGGGIYVVSTDRDVPLIWVCFSVIWYEYGSVILVQGICMTSTFYQMVLLWVVRWKTRVLLGILDIFDPGSTCMANNRIQWIIGPSPHEFQNWVHILSVPDDTLVVHSPGV